MIEHWNNYDCVLFYVDFRKLLPGDASLPWKKWETWSPPRVSIPPHPWLRVTFVSGIIICVTDRVTCHQGDIWLTRHPIISGCWIALYSTAIVITWTHIVTGCSGRKCTPVVRISSRFVSLNCISCWQQRYLGETIETWL